MIKTSFLFPSRGASSAQSITLHISALNQISTGLQNDVMLVPVLFEGKEGKHKFHGNRGHQAFVCFCGELGKQNNPRSCVIFPHPVRGAPQRAQRPGHTPALRIPRWDRRDKDAGVQLLEPQQETCTTQPGAMCTKAPSCMCHRPNVRVREEFLQTDRALDSAFNFPRQSTEQTAGRRADTGPR